MSLSDFLKEGKYENITSSKRPALATIKGFKYLTSAKEFAPTYTHGHKSTHTLFRPGVVPTMVKGISVYKPEESSRADCKFD